MSDKITTLSDDFVLPFRIEGVQYSGRLVRLGDAVDHALKAHDYPLPISMLLGEALTLAALIGTALKFEGTLTLQAQGDGPVGLVVADYRTPGQLRGYASFPADEKLPDIPAAEAIQLLGKGHFALTIDPLGGANMKRYQGIVPLEGRHLADCALNYFDRSEQIPTFIRTAVGPAYEQNKDGLHWRSGGIIIQRIAQEGGHTKPSMSEDDWTRMRYLLDTLEDHELLDPLLTAESLLFRLFHEDGVRVFTPPHPLAFGCQCSAKRVETVLTSFGSQGLEDIAVNGEIAARCEFCNREYRFKLVDLIHSQA